mmetsp:Transcript_23551/g.72729  ORF Transcript_23551/g.72729 Transcript_23551/m.72729 type:complete len:165 (-) Transcript_23551:387-881(-)
MAEIAASRDSGMTSRPLVFQCRSCRIIVGDSLSIDSTNERLNSLTLTRVSSLSQSEDITTSTAPDAPDRGSTFQALHCVQCTACLGKVYLTTRPELDSFRGRYTLDTNAICSYELGGGGNAQEDMHVLNGSVETELRTELHKIQGVILSMHERLLALETAGPAH